MDSVDWLYSRTLCEYAALIRSHPLDGPYDILVASTMLVVLDQTLHKVLLPGLRAMRLIFFRPAYALGCANDLDASSGKLIVHFLALVTFGFCIRADLEALLCHRLVRLLNITFDARDEIVVMVDTCRRRQFGLPHEFCRISFA